MPFYDLKALGYDQKQIKAFAGQYEMSDAPNREGKFFKRAGIAIDTFFPSPFANEEEAGFIFNGAYLLDLSLMARARVIFLPFFTVIPGILSVIILLVRIILQFF
ncbi:hypothetical protein MEC_00201 [Bartonella alsatica IBS 382]|uniref:Cytochrome c1 n=1 Tax=Bartonella alsatica IBS 382 TaxID=1094551 RepID=J0PSZ4_9HYPH|nr:cytochrome c1 [Bartonella alsatica]EJF75646.1 hypothetical protein MEC_00201 [Bartonella alsatica IBS 382]